MPHQRPRQILQLLHKRLTLLPIVGVLGARQTGKSTILRELLPHLRKTIYVTLDRNEIKEQARSHPTLFIQGLEPKKAESVCTVCIDEVQKAPVLFDTLKAEVDERRRPGRFALSGSTEFSKKTGIHDALTGRIALLRVYPLCQSEINQKRARYPLVDPIHRAALVGRQSLYETTQWLERGGMPGIFAVRDSTSRQSLYESWIETTCTRDLASFNIPRFNPGLARRILMETARAERPERSEIARAVGRTPRQIEAYFEAFKALFVLYEIEPYKTSVGKPQFFIFDAGIAHSMGASQERCLQIWFLNECFSQFSHSGEMSPDIFFYRTSRDSTIDFIVEAKRCRYAVKLSQNETENTYSLRAVEAFRKKHPRMAVIIAAPCLHILLQSNDGMTKTIPWSALT